MMKKLILLSFLLMIALTACSESIILKDMTVDQKENPLALDNISPRFGWKIEARQNNVMQKSYRIIVSDNLSDIKSGKGTLWDSGIVESSESQYVSYAGEPLESRDEAYWKVYVTTNAGEVESATGRFGIGLLDNSQWLAKWIGIHNPEDVMVGYTKLPARYLRKEFVSDGRIKKARLYICGLGLYEAYINGERIGSYIFTPTPSKYDVTTYYNTYDVTEKVKAGNNAIGVTLGNGRYTSMRQWGGEPLHSPVTMHFGLPMLLMQLEITYDDGSVETIVSDESWKITCNGPIVRNNEFDGEFYDARKELGDWSDYGYNDSDWKSVEIMNQPYGQLIAQPNPDIMIQDRLRPVSISEKNNSFIIDMGQNMVGWLQVRLRDMQPSDTIRIRFAETLNDDGSLYRANLRDAQATDYYVCGENSSTIWHPSFVYHGFRYAEVSGLRYEPSLKDFEGQVFYDSMKTTGNFHCSDSMISQIWKNAYWGIRGNYRGWPTDCPQRDERMPWTGDRTTGCYGEAYVFDNHLLYAKWLKDMVDSQRESGNLSNVAPDYWDLREDNLTWPAVLVTGADMLYKHYGDDRPIKEYYPAMKKWLGYMKQNYMNEDGVMTKDYYGDWCMPPEELWMIFSQDPNRITDGALISTAFYYHLCKLMASFARLQDFDDDATWYMSEAEIAKAALNKVFFNAEDGYYGNNTVTANILPLAFDMVPEEKQKQVFAQIVDKTMDQNGTHVSTGVVGIQNFMRTLTRFGRGDMAYTIASQDTYPSWGYMVKNGATTIWELWNGNTANPAMNSGNHVMLLGDLLIWMYEYIGGISPAAPGFKKISFKPFLIDGLDYASCSYESIYGTIVSDWKIAGGKFIWDILIPANTTADVHIPDGKGNWSVDTYGSGVYHIEKEIH